jgi:predicted flap endonuclease-1-like 5' DNA nuclease
LIAFFQERVAASELQKAGRFLASKTNTKIYKGDNRYSHKNGGWIMADTQDSKSKTIPENKGEAIPEPPRFDLKDLPEPPKIDDDMPDSKPRDMDIPSPMKSPGGMPKLDEPMEFKDVPKLDLTADFKKEFEDIRPPKKKGFLSGLFGKKEKRAVEAFNEQETIKIDIPTVPEAELQEPAKLDPSIDIPVPGYVPPPADMAPQDLPMPKFEDLKEPEAIAPIISTADEIHEQKIELKEPDWLEEGESFADNSTGFSAGQIAAIAKETPLSEVKGVGPKRAQKLKRAGIKSAESLAKHSHKELAKKLNLAPSQARSIVQNAQKITSIKKKIKDVAADTKKKKSISDVVRNLELEKSSLDRLSESDTIELEGHKEILGVLGKLEKKRSELIEMQQKVAEKEKELHAGNQTYKRDADYIDNLKRRLDHDVRERTQYLMNLEKEYFQKAQVLARMQSEVDIKDKQLAEREQFVKDKESEVKRKLNDLHDRDITLGSKEKKLGKMMDDLEKQDSLLKEKEEDLVSREEEYLKKLDILEKHEKTILRNLEEKRVNLSKKEKEIEARESRLHTEQRNVDKKTVAVEYAKNIVEQQKGKLIDDEFEQYLRDQLGHIDSAGIGKGDVMALTNMNIPLEDKNRSFKQLIDNCRSMIRSSKVAEAKVYYNQLRDRYYAATFDDPKEKDQLHSTIRQLYDEINLADIGRGI